ncbi:MAG: methylenetetrahydrofolate reductase [Ligilactobacillus ruminis]|nr:methylenetetrahydrofolate reductase [Ligilactobacillus ruminis]
MKENAEQGVDSLITQMFFDNESFCRFRECCILQYH